MNVFVIHTGTYSDYKLRAVCSTEKLAQMLIGQIEPGNDPEIMEVEVDGLIPEDGLYTYDCSTDLYEPDWQIRVLFGSDDSGMNIQKLRTFRRTPDGEGKRIEVLRFDVYVKASTRQEAEKIANEKRRKWAAEGSERLEMMIKYVEEKHGPNWVNWDDMDWAPLFSL